VVEVVLSDCFMFTLFLVSVFKMEVRSCADVYHAWCPNACLGLISYVK
jgi:hypothetical protein